MATATALAVVTPAVDVEAFIKEYRLYLYKICFPIIKHPDNTEDVVQQVCLQLFRKVHTFKGDSSFKTWATTVARNECFIYLRQQRAHERGLNRSVEQTETDLRIHAKRAVVAPVEYTGEDKANALWMEAIERLPKSSRRVFIAHVLEGKPYYEIAANLGLSLGCVKAYGARGANLLNTIVMGDSKFIPIRSTRPLVQVSGRISGSKRVILHLIEPRTTTKPTNVVGRPSLD